MTTQANWFEGFSAFIAEWTRKRETGQDHDYLGDNPFPHFVLSSKAKSWDDFLRWVSGLEGRWYFRGQREAEWGLHTSLDRAVERQTQTPHSFSLWHLNRKDEMQPLLYRFQQDAYNYLAHVPALDDIASWYALMQHHSAPTPLLDWTESPYVGMYFAVEEKPSLKRKREHDPHSGNPRLFAQQGVLLSKLVDEASFGQLLMTMMMHEKLTDRPVIRKLEVGSSLRIKFLKNLRVMNIHRASLFPGLDGLGSLLKLDLELKDRD